MKNFCIFLTLLSFTLAYSQENKIMADGPRHDVAPPQKEYNSNSGRYTSREVDKMAVLKECKSLDENNKNELQLCLADEIKNRISNHFSEFDAIADDLQLTESAVKIQFVLSKQGEIKDIKTFNFGSKELSAFSAKTLEESKSEIQFEPAQIKGEKVDLVFQLPVKYKRNRE